MAVYYDKNANTWTVRIHCKGYDNNYISTKHRGMKSKEDAIAWEEDFLRKNKYNPEAVTVKDYYMGAYKTDPAVQKEIKTNRTWNVKDDIFGRHIFPTFGHYAMVAVTEEKVKEWIKGLRDSGTLAESTIYNIVSHFKRLFHHAEVKIGVTNPFTRAVTKDITYTTKPFDYWTPEEYLAFRKEFARRRDIPQMLAVDLFYYGGLAKGECAALCEEDVEGNTVHVRFSKVDMVSDEIKTPTRFPRDVPIPDFLAEALREYFRVYKTDKKKNPFLFTFSFSALAKIIKECSKKAGVKPIQIREIQCSYIFLLKQQGVPFEQISRYTGTSFQNISNKYEDLLVNATLTHFDKLYPDKFLEEHEEDFMGSIKKDPNAGYAYTPTNCPYGYTVVDGKLVIDPAEAEVVRLVIGLYRDGDGMRMEDIVNILEEKGYKSRTGLTFRASYLNRIWRNKNLYNGTRPDIKGVYEPILSTDNPATEQPMDEEPDTREALDDAGWQEHHEENEDNRQNGDENNMNEELMNDLMSKNLSVSNAPYGYFYDKQAHKLIVNPKEAVVVYTVFGLKFFSQYSLTITLDEICFAINRCGYTNRKGRLFTIASIHSILKKASLYSGDKRRYQSITFSYEPILAPDYTPYKRFPSLERLDAANYTRTLDYLYHETPPAYNTAAEPHAPATQKKKLNSEEGDSNGCVYSVAMCSRAFFKGSPSLADIINRADSYNCTCRFGMKDDMGVGDPHDILVDLDENSNSVHTIHVYIGGHYGAFTDENGWDLKNLEGFAANLNKKPAITFVHKTAPFDTLDVSINRNSFYDDKSDGFNPIIDDDD